MPWDEIYAFFLQHTGVSYDFQPNLEIIKGDRIFLDTYTWKTYINTILDDLQDALDCIEEYGDTVPDTMPNKAAFKKLIAGYVLGGIMENLNYIKRVLNIDPIDISSYDDLEQHLFAVGKLVEMLTTHPLNEITDQHMFDTYITEDEEDDNAFVTLLGLHEKDVFNMYETISSIKEDYSEMLDEEEESSGEEE